MTKATDILHKYWRYDSFRKKQDVVIESVLSKRDTLALLPTGGGKSICYQVPGLMLDGCCLVISPLIALMQDQVNQLKQRGIKAVAISSGMSQKEIDIQLDNAIYGKTKFLYVSPERLKTRLFRARFDKMNINLIAVDEAHCISEWGYDFRPAYLDIAEIKDIKPNAPILALTATATPEVVEDIQDKLKFKDRNVFFDSFARSNISYNTLQSNNKTNRILEYLKGKTASGIVYCGTRKEVKNICKLLLDSGFNADFYHGGLDHKLRKEKQQKWIENKSQIMVCTNAFGMGIDKSDVRFVIHYDIPETIEAYFQEAGRAGRDGNEAETWLFYEPADLEKLREKIKLKYPPLATIKSVYNALGNYFQLAIGSGKEELFSIDVLQFADHYEFDLITTYNSLKFLELGGFLKLSENINKPSRARILVDQRQLYEFQVKDTNLNKIIQFLLRTQIGIFDELLPINERKIAEYTKVPLKDVLKSLQVLDHQNVIQYIPETKGANILYLTERLSEDNMSLPTEIYHQRKKVSESKMNAMFSFLKSRNCSSIELLSYFGEQNTGKCGKCNRCLNLNSKNLLNTDLKDLIGNYLNDKFNLYKEVSIQELIGEFKQYKKDDIIQTVRWLNDQNLVHTDKLGQKLRRP